MHELDITKSLVKAIEKYSKEPKEVIVELGVLSTYSKEPILFYFENFKKGDTKLVINEIPGKLHCKDCQKHSEVDNALMMMCPECESINIDVIDGKDVKIKEIIQ